MNCFLYKKRGPALRRGATKGFTLIELLIVIAILGLLTTIIMVGTASTRNKAKDSAIKSNLNNLRSNVAIWISANETYADFCVDNVCNCAFCSQDWRNACLAVKIQNSGQAVNCTLSGDNTAWCASSQLVGSAGYYCVDSTNKAQTQATACSAGACLP